MVDLSAFVPGCKAGPILVLPHRYFKIRGCSELEGDVIAYMTEDPGNYHVLLLLINPGAPECVLGISFPPLAKNFTAILEFKPEGIQTTVAATKNEATTETETSSAKAECPLLSDPTGENEYQRGLQLWKEEKYSDSVQYLKTAADAGHTLARYKLAKAFQAGKGVFQDLSLAYIHFSSVSLLLPKAQYRIGILLIYENSEKGAADSTVLAAQEISPKIREGLDALAAAAELGHSKASFALGKIYYTGDVVPKNLPLAAKLLTVPTKNGNPEALAILSELYAKGHIGKLPEEVLTFVEVLASQGDPRALRDFGMFHIQGTGVPEDHVKAAALFKEAIEKGDSEAEWRLGEMFRDARGGLPQDEAQAVTLFSSSAGKNIPGGQLNLGKAYRDGIGGLEANPEEGVKNFKLAADAGIMEARFLYARACSRGTGVPRNLREAASYFRLAANQGHVKAATELGLLLMEGATGVSKDKTEAGRHFKRAAEGEEGSYVAKYYLAVMKFKGRGMRQDPKGALALFYACADNPKATATLARKCRGEAHPNFFIGILKEGRKSRVKADWKEAAQRYRKSCESGYHPAFFRLGKILREGVENEIPKDLEEALKLFVEATKKGNSKAPKMLGEMYENGEGVNPDFATAEKYYRKAARRKNCEAAFHLGNEFQEGTKFPKNLEESTRFYQLAADLGNHRAQFITGKNYSNGVGVQVDKSVALTYYSKLDKNIPARYNCGLIQKLLRNGEAARANFKKCCDGDSYFGAYSLALLFEKGVDGVPKNFKVAKKFYGLASALGFFPADYRLGKVYLKCAKRKMSSEAESAEDCSHAKRTPSLDDEHEAALFYFKKAADQGYPKAMFEVGRCYARGIGVPGPDKAQAAAWYARASEKGNCNAHVSLGMMFRRGEVPGSPADPKKAAELYELALAGEKNNIFAANNLGWLHERGEGVARDLDKAMELYRQASEGGHQGATRNLELLKGREAR
jgi:TPR repeat protein